MRYKSFFVVIFLKIIIIFVPQSYTALLGGNMWRSSEILLRRKVFGKEEEYIVIDSKGGPRTFGTDSMACGSIVNSARGHEIVTIDAQGISWVKKIH